MPSKVKIVSKSDLEDLHTGSLMTRRKKLLACEETFQLSDRFGHETEPNPETTGFIEFKNTKAWKKAYSELKLVLSGREHYAKNK